MIRGGLASLDRLGYGDPRGPQSLVIWGPVSDLGTPLFFGQKFEAQQTSTTF